MSRSGDLPTTGNPNSSKEKRDKKGNIVQRRYYGGDGKAILNIDFDHDHGAGKPHAHDWDLTQDPPVRLPGRPLTAKEKRGK
jgi:Bacterial toxin 24